MGNRYVYCMIAAAAVVWLWQPREASACYPSCSSSCSPTSSCTLKCDGLLYVEAASSGPEGETLACNTITCGSYGLCQGMGTYCGDGSCNGSETCSNCPSDCGSCNYCGDGSCNGSETCASCPGDCGSCHYLYCSGSTPWHYADRFIYWFNNAVGDYFSIFQEEAITDSNSWHNYTDISLTSVSSGGTTDHIHAYSGYYGTTTGWLGLATIYRWTGCVIQEGHAILNRSYLDSSSYSRTNRKHVACQEIAHLFGLDHNRSETNTCMNDNILYAPNPNTRDRDAINALY